MVTSPLIAIKFANLISAGDGKPLLGHLDSVTIKPILDAGFFTQASGLYALPGQDVIEGTYESGGQFPKAYTISCNFNVIHEDRLDKSPFVPMSRQAILEY